MFQVPFAEENRDTIFPIYRHHGLRRPPLGIRDWELGPCNHPLAGSHRPLRNFVTTPRRERAVTLPSLRSGEALNQEGSPSALAACGAERSPVFLCASVVKAGLWDWVGRPFRARGLMRVFVAQAFSLGFVRSSPCGSKATADLARLGFASPTLRFLLKRGTKAVAARSETIHLAASRKLPSLLAITWTYSRNHSRDLGGTTGAHAERQVLIFRQRAWRETTIRRKQPSWRGLAG
jgi:hypothetical protein